MVQKETLTIKLDGPSLLIQEAGKASRWIPLRQLERVVLFGNMTLETSILCSLAEEGIPILLINGKGSKPVMVSKIESSGVQKNTRQHFYFRRPPYTEEINNWLISKRKSVILKVFKKISSKLQKKLAKEGLSETRYMEIIEHLKKNNPRWQILNGILRAMLLEFLLPLIEKAKLDPHCGVKNRGVDFGFALDLCWVFEPEIHYQTMRFFKDPARRGGLPWFPSGDLLKEIVVRFEERRKFLLSEVNVLLDELNDLLRQIDGDVVPSLLRRRRSSAAQPDT